MSLSTDWHTVSPRDLRDGDGARVVAAYVAQLLQVAAKAEDLDGDTEAFRRRCLREAASWPDAYRLVIAAAMNLYVDLLKQGWTLRLEGHAVEAQRPSDAGSSANEDRAVKRQKLGSARNHQLREPAVREFISKMERTTYRTNGRVSVFSLMRDGRELSSALAGAAPMSAVPHTIKPYLSFAEEGATCEATGLAIQDIWRYFRHTWSSPYDSVPGRSMNFLVRDAATPHHAIIGLGALSSAAMQLDIRDREIGWEAKGFLEECRSNPTQEIGEWARGVIGQSISSIYRADLIADGLIPPHSSPVSDDVIQCLKSEAERARKEHQTRGASADYKPNRRFEDLEDHEWEQLARSPLFRSKRALELAQMLQTKAVFDRAYDGISTRDGLERLLSSSEGKQAFLRVVKTARSMTIGTEIADLTVCGAVPPYNELLGGKLVAMLAASPEVVKEYKRRYGNAPSVIGSSMAGRRIVRPANLVFIGTTSLYGIRPNQYDRISVPCGILGGSNGSSIRYKAIGERTEGVGTFQFGRATKAALEKYFIAEQNGRRVNNVFGEGANPKMRALRDALSSLGLDADAMLKHGLRKVVYGVPLVSNLRNYLLGISSTPQYLFSLEECLKSSEAIADFWAQRWLLGRLRREDVCNKIKRHSLVHPIRHGARVQLPEADVEQATFLDRW